MKELTGLPIHPTLMFIFGHEGTDRYALQSLLSTPSVSQMYQLKWDRGSSKHHGIS